MKIFADKSIKGQFWMIAAIMAAFSLLLQIAVWNACGEFSLAVFFLSLFAMGSVLAVCFCYFHRQNKIVENATAQINAYLAGDTDARIECDSEGGLYQLFHAINTLAAVLNAHAEKELRAKEFLKDTISDISHQLKTPLAALNIYNGLLQGEAEELPAIREFAQLSEQELDRIETLVQSLLKITRLDAGSIVIEKSSVNVADMMRDIELHFAYRAKQEGKEILLSGREEIQISCDRDWMMEAVSNIVKNALDHTDAGGHIRIEWKQAANLTEIIVRDDGKGIPAEDIHHIFKRFYRSRLSQDKQGIGLGLPLAKAIIETHEGNITVDSVPGQGSVFAIHITKM